MSYDKDTTLNELIQSMDEQDKEDVSQAVSQISKKYGRQEVMDWSRQEMDEPSILARQPIKKRSDFNLGFLMGFTHPIPTFGWFCMMLWVMFSHQDKNMYLATVCFALVVTSIIVRYKLKQEIKNAK